MNKIKTFKNRQAPKIEISSPDLCQISGTTTHPQGAGGKIGNKSKKMFIFVPTLVLLTMVMAFWLSPQRQSKMDIEIKGIKSKLRRTDKTCEQYALVALVSGWYPCYNCGTETLIYLNKDEVWKYGKTCNEEKGRYPNGLPIDGLIYIVQFTGTEEECLIEEKRKIYNYPNLPECILRKVKLMRPPGNKIDK